MKGKFKFTVFIIIFVVLFGACLYGMAYAANISDEIAAENYSGSFWSSTRATIAVWMFAALAVLSAAGIVSGILKSKAAHVIFILLFTAMLALSGYFGFLHLKSMPWHVTGENVIKLIMFIVLIVVAIIGIIVNILSLAKKPKN